MVEPALRRVSLDDGREEILQPRTMQVLAFFASMRGQIIARHDLTMKCWSGVAVGDDSINRVIAQLRRLAEGIGRGSFTIETITKVGYRLIVPSTRLPVVHAQLGSDPIATTTPERALTPAPAPDRVRSAVWLGGVAVLLWLGMWWIGYAAPSSPDVVIERFATTGSSAGMAETLRSAIVSTNMPSKFRARDDAGKISDYRLTGRIVGSADGGTVYAELRAPGSGSPIWTPQIRYFGQPPIAGIASELALAARCIIEGVVEPPTAKPPVAVAGWAKYCEYSNKSDWDEDLLLDTLRATVQAEPRFVSAQVTLASTLAYHVMHNGGRDPDGMRAEALKALAVAEQLDPQNSNIFLTRAALTPLDDFVARDAFLSRALIARPGGWGEEFNAEGYHLEAVGRIADSIVAYKRSIAILPENPITTIARAEVLSLAGRYSDAYPIFRDRAATEPDRTRLHRIWLAAALTGQDWATVRRLIPTVPDDQVRAAVGPLVEALANGNKLSAFAAGTAFERIARNSRSPSALTVLALALSGHDLAAISAARRRFETVGYNNSLGSIYSPAFARARQTSEFEAMVRKMGLFRYWRASSHRPDFCAAAEAPPLCGKL